MPNFAKFQTVAEIWPFLDFFQDDGVRYLGFFKVENFDCLYPSESQYMSPCQILCTSVNSRPHDFAVKGVLNVLGGVLPKWFLSF